MILAEKYLVRACKNIDNINTFNELRLWSYKFSKNFTLADLPPTTDSIRLHILRSYFVTYMYINCLNNQAPKLNPINYGFRFEGTLLVPQKVEILLPPPQELIPNCTCTTCTRQTCVCRSNNIACISFCFCKKKEDKCKNLVAI